MSVNIYNKDFYFIRKFDNYNSFQCNKCYRDAGVFTFKTRFDEDALSILKVGNIVEYKEFAGIIESILIEDSVDETPTLTASGRSLESILSYRIIWDNFTWNGNLEEFIYNIVYDNVANPIDPKRQIKRLMLPPFLSLPANTERTTENENVLEECIKVCKIPDYGFKIDLWPKTFSSDYYDRQKQMLFMVYKGDDKTKKVTIGRKYDNVSNQDYMYSTQDNLTTVKVVNDVTNVVVGDTAEGMSRREDIIKSDKKQEDGVSLNDFKKELEYEGVDKLRDTVECFDADVVNVDLKAGDKVTVFDKKLNIHFETRIMEKHYTVEEGHETITYILGEDI